MPMLWLTLRNLFNNRRRTAITLTSIIIGCASLIFVWGFVDGINSQMVDNSTGYVSGHIKVHRAGFHASKELNIAIDQASPMADTLQKQPDIAGYSPRLEGVALVSVGEKSRMMQVIGVAPDTEAHVTQIKQAVIEGRYLLPGESNEVVLGDDALAAFGATVGDEVVLITQAADGSIGADRFRIVGRFNTGIEVMDRNLAYITLASAQELYSLWGRVTAWAIRLTDRNQLASVVAQLKTQLSSEYEVLSWQEMMPSLYQMLQFHEVVGYVVLFVVFTVVTAGIANTILMSVMERTREFGVMMALGTQRSQILILVLSESLFIGVVGVVIGSLLGIAINHYFGMHGIDFGQFTQAMETMPGLSGIVYLVTDMNHVWLIDGIVLGISLLPALYPAWRASRLQPVAAIKGLRTAAGTQVFHGVFTGWRQSSRVQPEHPNEDSAGFQRWVFWQIAFRSMLRNPRRSLLTAGATAFGLAAYWFLYAFADGFFEQMIENSTSMISGHIQISEKDFRRDYLPELRVNDRDKLMTELAQYPEIEAVAPRIIVKGMLASARKSWPVEMSGIEPSLEKQVTKLSAYVVQGAYVNDSIPNGIVVGAALADKLGVALGDKVVFTTQQAGGDLASSAYSIMGIFDTGSEVFDEGYVSVPFHSLQTLMGFDAQQASVIAMRLKSRFLSQPFAHVLSEKLQPSSLQVQPWESIMPVVVQMVEMTKIDFYMILIVVFIVVAIGVMNTMLMSVLERTREFGVIMALGTQGAQMVRMVLYEAIVLGIVGMLAGAVLGGMITSYYGHYGIDLGSMSRSMETIPGLTRVIYPVLILDHIWLPSLLLFLCGVAVTVYPAMKAARLNPVEAIRHG